MLGSGPQVRGFGATCLQGPDLLEQEEIVLGTRIHGTGAGCLSATNSEESDLKRPFKKDSYGKQKRSASWRSTLAIIPHFSGLATFSVLRSNASNDGMFSINRGKLGCVR